MFFLEEGIGLGIEELGKATANTVAKTAVSAVGVAWNPFLLVVGIVLIVLAIVVLMFLKRIIINSVLGFVVWVLIFWVFKINLPLIPSLAVSIIFGLAGIGVMLLLKFFGIF